MSSKAIKNALRSLPMIPFPNIDPIALEIGPLAIRWYSLAYVTGFLGGWWYIKKLINKDPNTLPTHEQIDDFITWAMVGVILGGRLGYVLFYNLPYFIDHPSEILQLWQGGMSFHGGLLGVVAAVALFTWKHKIPTLRLGDLASTAAPIGIFFGRIANFINGELFGRETDMPWGIIFPHGGPNPRHPSQLYEAILEGLILFIILYIAAQSKKLRNAHGFMFGILLSWYGFSRFIVEFFREPDAHLGFIGGFITMGQILTIPMILCGLGLMTYTYRKHTKTS